MNSAMQLKCAHFKVLMNECGMPANNKAARHFPYKHPTFGTKARPKPEREWQRSVYYWWWAYLRRNQSYLAACAAAGGEQMAKIYADFGDVRCDDFKGWWSKRGVHLFAEPTAENTVRVVTNPSGLVLDGSTLTISLPLGLPKRFLEKRIGVILAEHHKGRRGHQLAKCSRARYRVRGQPNIPALKLGLAVYDHWRANPGMPLWLVGDSLRGFQMEHKLKPTDPAAIRANKKNVLAATVSRYLRRVKASIAATGEGVFP